MLELHDLEVLCKPSMRGLIQGYLSLWMSRIEIEGFDCEQTYNLITYLYNNWKQWFIDCLSGEHTFDNLTKIVVADCVENGVLFRE